MRSPPHRNNTLYTNTLPLLHPFWYADGIHKGSKQQYSLKKSSYGFIFIRISGMYPKRRGLLLVFLQMYRLVRENLKGRLIMYTALFIISIIAFGYLMYVLVKPEKF